MIHSRSDWLTGNPSENLTKEWTSAGLVGHESTDYAHLTSGNNRLLPTKFFSSIHMQITVLWIFFSRLVCSLTSCTSQKMFRYPFLRSFYHMPNFKSIDSHLCINGKHTFFMICILLVGSWYTVLEYPRGHSEKNVSAPGTSSHLITLASQNKTMYK